ncbi:MAG: sugar ABC transporter substrate-binding protein, partial [Pseudomonadota bacterium]
VPQRLDVNFQIVLSEGGETRSIKPDVSLPDYVALDRPGELIMGHGMGPDYDPATFAVNLPN